MTASITVDGPLARVTFEPPFDLDSHRLFLACKKLPEKDVSYDWESDRYLLTTPARFASLLGAAEVIPQADWLSYPAHLFDYQRWILDLALPAERFACWADTGTGKSAVLLEYARQVQHATQGRVLILEELQVIDQLLGEAQRFYGDGLQIARLSTREALADWCQGTGPGIAITNKEKLIPGVLPELRYLAGLIVDEASFLRTGGGTIKWNLIKSARGIRFKLSLTATPAPNDTMEYASQASFLEKLRDEGGEGREGGILWTYFQKNKQGDWVVKPHARADFYRFMATWSVYLRDPAVFGFRDILASLPDPDIREYRLGITDQQRELMYGLMRHKGGLFTDDRLGIQESSKLSQLAKGFLYGQGQNGRTATLIPSEKPAFVADLVRADVADGRQVLVWTVFDAESDLIREALKDAPFDVGVLDGSMPDTARLDTIAAFKSGALPVLISKAQLLGYGLNFQNCRSMVFSGFDFSFERLYQAIRRAYRYGQTETVRVHIPYIPELEGAMFTTLRQKEERFLADVTMQERHYRDALRGESEAAA